MPEEARIGSTLLEELVRAEEQGRLRSQLEERWIEAGLPREPVDGRDGEAQLRLAVDLLRRFAVTAEAAWALHERWRNGDDVDRDGEPIVGWAYVEVGGEPRQLSEPVRPSVPTARWLQDAARLRMVAEAIEAFLTDRQASDG